MDPQFTKTLQLFAHNHTARSWFEVEPDNIRVAARCRVSLPGGNIILAARNLTSTAGHRPVSTPGTRWRFCFRWKK
ncbi:MAG TPA: hypothetical protein VEI74_02905 [Candidatus Methylomirabilis sp.]|nr:hypothetical protein [Candidatus Methylomirabilis sp.]